ncbi:MAG: metal-binding protein [Rhizobiales bacterium]|jgi:methylphosphotriester-DNA--protein-cysteine methyltransferase|nr:metal-binding protein [Hyphomicrobiales bacterium]
MISHLSLADQQLASRIKAGKITMAGHGPARIFGRLDCRSGKRMLRRHRVFFADRQDALAHGFRPCGHCLPLEYRQWRALAVVSPLR